MCVAPAGGLFPRNGTPHASITLLDPDIGNAVGHLPVAGRIQRERGRKTRRQNKPEYTAERMNGQCNIF